MTDSTNRPDDGRSDIAEPDGGHLHEVPQEATPPGDEGAAFRAQQKKDRRGLLVPVVATAIVAALLGGGVGAGVGIVAARSSMTTTAAAASNQGIVINNAETATDVSAVAVKASPSVVTISVSSPSESGTGSGIVMSADGYVLTNNHVVTLDGETSTGTITVTTSAGRLYKAKIVGTDPLNDLAVIKLTDATGLTPAAFADSRDLNVGDPVVAIGAPLDLPNTVTTGIVSALNRSITVASSAVPNGSSGSDSNGGGEGGSGSGSPFNFWDFGDGGDAQSQQQPSATTNIYLSVLQTDAAINPGNSGGALLNAKGQVIGVNVAIAGTGSSSGGQSGSIGVGFSIPSTIAKRIADEIVAGEKVTHGQIGIQAVPDRSTSTGTVAGVEVADATAGSAAAAAGIEKGDVITAIGGVPVTDYADLAGQVRSYPGGTRVEVSYARDGQSRTVEVVLGTYSATS